MAIKKAKQTARKAAPTKTAARPQSWNNSEILYAVLGYLTTREEPLILSSHHSAAAVAEILGGIIEANGLPKPRQDYPKIKIPEGLEKITNVPKPQQPKAIQADCQPQILSPDEIGSKVLNLLLNQAPEDQNRVMETVIKTLAQARQKEAEYLSSERNRFNDQIERSHKNNEHLARILKESF